MEHSGIRGGVLTLCEWLHRDFHVLGVGGRDPDATKGMFWQMERSYCQWQGHPFDFKAETQVTERGSASHDQNRAHQLRSVLSAVFMRGHMILAACVGQETVVFIPYSFSKKRKMCLWKLSGKKSKKFLNYKSS